MNIAYNNYRNAHPTIKLNNFTNNPGSFLFNKSWLCSLNNLEITFAPNVNGCIHHNKNGIWIISNVFDNILAFASGNNVLITPPNNKDSNMKVID